MGGKIKPPTTLVWPHSHDDLKHVIASGDCDRVRKLFDDAFWQNFKLVPDWLDLRIALERHDEPMVRLLITWGARAPQTELALKGIIAPEELTTYAKILRRYGVDATILEKVAAETSTAPAKPSRPAIGEMVAGQGIYIGQWEAADKDGKSLGKIFNIFAAPQDLSEEMAYMDIVMRVSSLKNWNGFDGTNYQNDEDICTALKDGSYKGGWMIPPLELLAGDGLKGRHQSDNLFQHREAGSLRGVFGPVGGYGGSCYWSSTRSPGLGRYQYAVPSSHPLQRIASDLDRTNFLLQGSCRLVRLVEVPGAKEPAKNNDAEKRFLSTGRVLPPPPPPTVRR